MIELMVEDKSWALLRISMFSASDFGARPSFHSTHPPRQTQTPHHFNCRPCVGDFWTRISGIDSPSTTCWPQPLDAPQRNSVSPNATVFLKPALSLVSFPCTWPSNKKTEEVSQTPPSTLPCLPLVITCSRGPLGSYSSIPHIHYPFSCLVNHFLFLLSKVFLWHLHHQRQESSKTTETVCSWQGSYPMAFPNHTFIASPPQMAWGPWGQIPLRLHPWFCPSYLRSSLIYQTLSLSGSINLLITLSSFSNTQPFLHTFWTYNTCLTKSPKSSTSSLNQPYLPALMNPGSPLRTLLSPQPSKRGAVFCLINLSPFILSFYISSPRTLPWIPHSYSNLSQHLQLGAQKLAQP